MAINISYITLEYSHTIASHTVVSVTDMKNLAIALVKVVLNETLKYD